jgi:hypothetical protein
MSIGELAAVVLEVQKVYATEDACGVPCPWGSGHTYCGRQKGHPATDPDHHFTRTDVYEFAAPLFARHLAALIPK